MNDSAAVESEVIEQKSDSSQDLAHTQTQELAQAPNEASNIMQAVINAASDPTMDIDRVDRLLAIRDKIMAQEAEGAYAGAMSRAQANIGPIAKNQENDHTHSTYSDLSAINAVVVPMYTAQGFALSFSNRPSNIDNHIVVMCDVMHIDGHTKHYEYELPYDGVGTKGNATKTAIHASASSVKYGQRYLTTMIFNIATFDDDGNAGGKAKKLPANGITDETVDEIIKGLDITGKTQQDGLDYINQVSGNDYDRLTQFSEKEGKRLLYKLNKCVDGEQE